MGATFLPDSGEALRKATAKGLELGAILIKKDEGKDSFVSCFAFCGSDTLYSEEKEALKVKLERENSPESLFVPQAIPSETTRTTRPSHTSLSSGPYAGLTSAKKRVRDDMDESQSSLGPKKKAARKVAFPENVDLKEEAKSSFGPAKKLAKKFGALKNV